ncbi:MAG: class I SAM-dependent methyltransferase [Dehalococcoidia bacterium]|nr:class I SAM-dependent methyltransferase [Dehalococcoidia bacterium]
MTTKVTEIDHRIVSRLGDARAILDVGCGDGRLTWLLAQETNCEIIGIDLSRSGFRKAKRIAHQAGVGHLVRCLKGDVCHLNFPNGQFDLVILSYSLHHIEDSPAALREIHRVLRPGGTIIISEHEVKEGGTLGDCYQFTLAELMKSLDGAGFADTRWERVDGDILLSAINKIREEAWTSNRV